MFRATGGRDRESFDISDTDKSSGNKDDIKAAVDELIGKKNLTPRDIIDLYDRYKDEEVISEILNQRDERFREIKRRAQRLANKIYKQFVETNKPLHEILRKMMKYKVEKKWTDTEYDEFRKELSALLTGRRAYEVDYNQNITAYRSRINRALGSTRITVEDGIRIKDAERPVLHEIIAMYEKSISLHKSVVMHSLMYEDCSIVAMSGKFKRDKNIASNYIHPIIACMFLPKFDIFEYQMLYSNFGYIIKMRNDKRPIVDEPNSLLFNAITTDPNDVVCDISSPIADLKNRFRVQISLWETVLKLRNGSYYEATPIGDFLQALNACRNNLYDEADLAYNQDDGAIMRKILSVFSLRPTIIHTKPISSIATFAGPYAASMGMNMGMGLGFPMGDQSLGQGFGMQGMQGMQGFGQGLGTGAFPFSNQPIHTVTAIPMITVQIPMMANKDSEPRDLRAATKQTIWITEKKTIIPKEQSIIYSKEVLIFYVNRRIQRVQIRTFSNPITFSQLPMTMSSFDRLNTYPVNVPDIMVIGSVEETYQLRSVVAATETEIRQGDKTTSIITGSNGLIMSHRDLEKGIFAQKYYLYDPFGASLPVRYPGGASDEYFTNKPISYIDPFYAQSPELTGGVINKSFYDRASQAGTIFIYAKPQGFGREETILI